MFPFTLLLILALQTASEGGDQKLSASIAVVEVSLNTLRRVCPNATERFHGCTRFVEPELSTECLASDGIWSMRTRARYKAFVFAANSRIIGHERLHLRDIERGVTAHLRKLETGRYATEAACRGATEAAATGFHAKLQELARESQRQRHGK